MIHSDVLDHGYVRLIDSMGGWQMTIILVLAFLWLGTGIYFVTHSRSRGWKADVLFVFTWPINAFLDWRDGR